MYLQNKACQKLQEAGEETKTNPKTARNYKKLKRNRVDLPLELLEGEWPHWYLDFRRLSSRTVNK